MNRVFCSPIIVIALLGAACSAVPQAVPAGSGSEVAQPKHGGTLLTRISRDFDDQDVSYTGQNFMTPMAYSSLLAFKKGPDVKYDELTLEPELAERWEVAPDAKTFTFHLRKGVKYANLPPVNGRELTSADIKWSYEYATRTGQFKGLPPGNKAWMFEGIDRVETPDPYTAVVHFQIPNVPFIYYSADDVNPIMPREIFEQDGHYKDRIVGSGPFQLDVAASQKGSRYAWKKHPGYWEQGKPYLDEVRWVVVADSSAALAAFQTKQLDHLGVESFDYRTSLEFKKQNPEAVLHQYPSEAGLHMYILTSRPPLNDLRVRRALAMAIDREELSRLYAGGSLPWSPTGAMIGLFTDEEARKLHRYDPAEARRLLTEAGHSRVDIVMNYPGKTRGEVFISIIELLQAQLKKAGIDMALKSIDPTEASQERRRKDYYVALGSLAQTETGDWDQAIFKSYHGKSPGNYGDYVDPELDRLLEAQRAEVDAAKRKELLRSAVKRITDNVYALDLIYLPNWQAWQPWLKNYAVNRGQRGGHSTHFDRAWLDK